LAAKLEIFEQLKPDRVFIHLKLRLNVVVIFADENYFNDILSTAATDKMRGGKLKVKLKHPTARRASGGLVFDQLQELITQSSYHVTLPIYY